MTSKKTGIGIVSIIIIAAVTTAGFYIFNFEGGIEDASAEQVKAWTLDSTENVSSHTYEMETNMIISITAENETGKMEMLMETESSVDIGKQKAKSTTQMEMESASGNGLFGENKLDKSEISTITYIIENSMYTKTSIGENRPGWIKSELPFREDIWRKNVQLGQQEKLLRSSDVSKLEDEEIEGQRCYVIEVYPNPENLLNVLSSRSRMTNPLENMPFDLGKLIENVTLKEWISKNNNLLKKTRAKIKINMDFMGVKMTENITMDITYRNYNEPVEIELPKEAENAKMSDASVDSLF